MIRHSIPKKTKQPSQKKNTCKNKTLSWISLMLKLSPYWAKPETAISNTHVIPTVYLHTDSREHPYQYRLQFPELLDMHINNGERF